MRGSGCPVEAPIDTSIGAAAGLARAAGILPSSVQRHASAKAFRPSSACRARAAPAAARRSCRRRPSSCDGPPSRRCRPPSGRSTFRPGSKLVRQRADVEEGAGGVDQLRELALNDAPVDMLDGERRADDAGKRMQHDEAGAVGDEIGERLSLGGEGERAVGAPLDPRGIAKRLLIVLAERVVGDREAGGALIDLQVRDLRDCRCPSCDCARDRRWRGSPPCRRS